MKTQDDLILEQLYTEGIFDRIKQRVHGAGSWLQGKGYNAGKTEKLNQTLKDRIKNDIDKFLKDIVTMGGLTDLADFEKQYPHFAQKVACMAEAIGHTTALTTKCTAVQPPPPPTTPLPTTPIPTTPIPTTPPPKKSQKTQKPRNHNKSNSNAQTVTAGGVTITINNNNTNNNNVTATGVQQQAAQQGKIISPTTAAKLAQKFNSAGRAINAKGQFMKKNP